jgi:hypothetical protein
MAMIAIVILIALIIGGKYWIEHQEIQSNIAQSELKLLEGIEQYQITQLEVTNAMTILTKELKDTLGVENLNPTINQLNQS